MSPAVAGSVVAAVVLAFVNAGVVAVGWTNKRRRPKPTDRPYLVKMHGPSVYATLACLALVAGVTVTAVAAGLD